MLDMHKFKFDGQDVHVVVNKDDDGLWFVLDDICDILGVDQDSIIDEVDDEDMVFFDLSKHGLSPETLVINLYGLTTVVSLWDSENARNFLKFATTQVLPKVFGNGVNTTSSGYIVENDDAACLKAARILEDSPVYMSLDQFLMILGDFNVSIRSVDQLMDWFCENGYMTSDPECSNRLILTRWSEDNAWFCVGTEDITIPTGSHIHTTTYYLSGAGQIYFLNLFATAAGK